MEQILIATHTIKPSSSTPAHLKTHTLSSLDQSVISVYTPIIFYYQNHDSDFTEISRCLRRSLSEVLTIFYPLAGTVRENSFVDCNDGGAQLMEARVHARLARFTQHPQTEELDRLLPTGSLSHRDDQLLLVKANYFDCGGVALGVCFSHKIGDAASLTMFMNAWAATCRGESSRIIPPSFDLAFHFPPTPTNLTTANHSSNQTVTVTVTDEKIITKTFVFEREKLEKLKELQASKVKNPTNVEALSAFIWKTAIEACKAKSQRGSRPFVAFLAVNLRPRTVPPIPDHTIGNCVSVTTALVSWEEDEREIGVHLSKLRAAIRGVNDDYINHVIKDGEKLSRVLGELGNFTSKEGNCVITSWWRFPMYEVDFGWGKPVWVSSVSSPRANTVILISTPSGDGIEAWVSASSDNFGFIQLLEAKYNKLLLH